MSKAEDLQPTPAAERDARPAARKPAAGRKPANTKKAARPSRAGDTAPDLSAGGIEQFEIEEAISAAEDSKLVAITDILKTEAAREPRRAARALEAILAGASPDDIHVLRRALMRADTTPFHPRNQP